MLYKFEAILNDELFSEEEQVVLFKHILKWFKDQCIDIDNAGDYLERE